MNCIPLALAALAALLTTPLAAQPITRSCDYKGDGKLGPLTIAFDEAARSVRVTTHDGRIYRYQDGVTGRISPPSNRGRPRAGRAIRQIPAGRGRGRLPLARRRLDRPSRLFRPRRLQGPGQAVPVALAVELRDRGNQPWARRRRAQRGDGSACLLLRRHLRQVRRATLRAPSGRSPDPSSLPAK